jgi:hypothetical protein
LDFFEDFHQLGVSYHCRRTDPGLFGDNFGSFWLVAIFATNLSMLEQVIILITCQIPALRACNGVLIPAIAAL